MSGRVREWESGRAGDGGVGEGRRWDNLFKGFSE